MYIQETAGNPSKALVSHQLYLASQLMDLDPPSTQQELKDMIGEAIAISLADVDSIHELQQAKVIWENFIISLHTTQIIYPEILMALLEELKLSIIVTYDNFRDRRDNF